MSKETSKGFCLFFDWVHDLECVEDADAWKIVKAICAYYEDGTNPVDAVPKELKLGVRLMFSQIMRQQELSQKQAEGARIANAKRKPSAPTDKPDAAASDSSTADTGCNTIDTSCSSTDTNCTVTDSTPAVTAADPSPTRATETETSTETNTETKTETHKRESSTPPSETSLRSALPKELQEKFNSFWELYPRKCGKSDALKAFAKLAPDDPLTIRILEALNEQRNSPQWQDYTFIPFPANWLRDRRWEDLTSPPPPTRSHLNLEDFFEN